jgi:hypothetical protein
MNKLNIIKKYTMCVLGNHNRIIVDTYSKPYLEFDGTVSRECFTVYECTVCGKRSVKSIVVWC